MVSLLQQRAPVLVFLLLVQSLSSSILNAYSALLQSHIALAMAVSMVVGTGGNAGNQSAVLVTRSLARRAISPSEVRRVMRKEFVLSLFIGAGLGLLGFLRMSLFGPADVMESLAIGCTIALVIVLSMFVGVVLPVALDSYKLDPAWSSTQFTTTLTDVAGVSIFMLVSAAILLG